MVKAINKIVRSFGFEDFHEFFRSCFKLEYKMVVLGFGTTLGAFFGWMEVQLGISAVNFGWFLVLLLLEMVTGIIASVREGNKIQSRKFDRILIKGATYTLILMAINSYCSDPEVGVHFTYVYYIFLMHVILGLIISIAENVARIDKDEKTLLSRVLRKVLNKIIDLPK